MPLNAVALAGLLFLAFSPVACQKRAPVQTNPGVQRTVKDTTPRVVIRPEDTARVKLPVSEARSFNLGTPAQRDSLRATLRRERALWQAARPRDYQFLLRVDCFCPGVQGWLQIEVRSGQPLRARNVAGKAVPITDWNTLSIDGLFDNLERTADINGEVTIAFDSRWHFPVYVRTIARPGPDRWSVTEARALRPIQRVSSYGVAGSLH